MNHFFLAAVVVDVLERLEFSHPGIYEYKEAVMNVQKEKISL